MARFPTARQVLDRIRWDPRLDERDFVVGYAVRGGTIAELPFAEFLRAEDIPWHRVRRVRRGAEVVWDRAARLYKLG